MHKSPRVEVVLSAANTAEQARELANGPHRKGPFTIYARVHVFPEKEAAAICVAVGTHVTVENGKATYSW